MSKDPVTLGNVTSSIKELMNEIKDLNEEQTAVFIYGMYRAQSDDKDITLHEAIEYSKNNWSDLY